MGSAQSKVEVDQSQRKAVSEPVKQENVTPMQEETESKESSGGGCPMKKVDGSYSYDWRALFQRHPHGAKGSTPLTKDDLTQNANGSVLLATDNNAAGGGCPVKHAPPPPASSGGGCPVKEYNVYSQPIDATNQMPANPNQLPAPGQQKELSTNRVTSSISKVRAQIQYGFYV